MTQRKGKELEKARYKDCQSRIVRNVQRIFLVSDTTQPEALINGKAPDSIPCATGKGTKRSLRDVTEGKVIVVVLNVLSRRSRKKQMLVQLYTWTKLDNTSKTEKKEKYKEEDYREADFDVKQAGVIYGGLKEQVSFE